MNTQFSIDADSIKQEDANKLYPGTTGSPQIVAGHESRLKYFEMLIDELDPSKQEEHPQKQVKVTNFDTKMPKNRTKSASGYPATNRMQRTFKQPGFKKAQMYLPKNEKPI